MVSSPVLLRTAIGILFQKYILNKVAAFSKVASIILSRSSFNAKQIRGCIFQGKNEKVQEWK